MSESCGERPDEVPTKHEHLFFWQSRDNSTMEVIDEDEFNRRVKARLRCGHAVLPSVNGQIHLYDSHGKEEATATIIYCSLNAEEIRVE
jgi:hypothetical protein